MNDKLLDKTQKKIIALLLTLSNDLHIAAKDQCSEVARLVGCWLLTEHSEYSINILKGNLSDGLAHDVLCVTSDKLLFLIDPTVWQSFPESKSIFIGSAQDIPGAINLLMTKYGGSWEISETMKQCDDSCQQELLAIIKKNRQEI